MSNYFTLLESVQAIVFDLDGTLVHSSLDFAKIRSDIGCPEGKDVLTFLDSLTPSHRQAAESIIHQHELHDASSTRAIKGALDLLARLREAGFRTAIVTRNSSQATEMKLKTCGITVEQVLTRESAPPKPDPSALLQLSRYWNLSPNRCVYIGDYLYDLQAANQAGMHACLYFDARDKALPGFAELADFICDDFDAFETCLLSYLESI